MRHAALLTLLLALPAVAQEPGSYRIDGTAAVGSYGGEARIDRGELELRRSDGLRARAPLVREEIAGVASGARVWRFEAALPATSGLAGGLTGANGADRVLRARYLELHDRLVGRWRIVGADGATLADGQETLVRATPAPRGRVRVAVSVDWEGRDLTRANLDAFAALRDALPGVRITHFLNAAYLTKPAADVAAVTSAHRRVVLAGDELGLHVHGWRTLFRAAGVAFRDRPSFWGDGFPLQPTADDLGHEVELGAYTVDELRAVVRRSRELLASIGLPIGASFRAGGWMATPEVLQAVRAEGFLVDSSATWGGWHDELAGLRLQRRIPQVWPQVTPSTAPFAIDTPAGPILEMPDTCALADYVTPDEMVAHVRDAAARLARAPERDLFVHVGFHQETAARHGPRLVEALRRVAADRSLPVVLETLAESARAAR